MHTEDKIEEKVTKMKMMNIMVVKELLANSNDKNKYYIFADIIGFLYIIFNTL